MIIYKLEDYVSEDGVDVQLRTDVATNMSQWSTTILQLSERGPMEAIAILTTATDVTTAFDKAVEVKKANIKYLNEAVMRAKLMQGVN